MLVNLLVAVCSVLAAAPNLPEHLQPLAAVWEDEKALTDALRAYDKTTLERINYLSRSLAPGEQPPAGEIVPMSPQALSEIKQSSTQLREAYELALGSYPDNARLHNYYGELLYDQFGETAGALKEWHLAQSADEEYSAPYNNLAIHYFHVGEYKMGLRHLDLALKYDKENPDYLFNASNIYLVHGPQVGEIRKWDKKKVYREAMKMAKKAAKLAPEDFELLQDYAMDFYAAENFEEKADWEEAAAAWQAARAKARNDAERFNCWLNEGRVWKRGGDAAKAAPCIEEALKLRPESPHARDLLESVKAPAAS